MTNDTKWPFSSRQLQRVYEDTTVRWVAVGLFVLITGAVLFGAGPFLSVLSALGGVALGFVFSRIERKEDAEDRRRRLRNAVVGELGFLIRHIRDSRGELLELARHAQERTAIRFHPRPARVTGDQHYLPELIPDLSTEQADSIRLAYFMAHEWANVLDHLSEVTGNRPPGELDSVDRGIAMTLACRGFMTGAECIAGTANALLSIDPNSSIAKEVGNDRDRAIRMAQDELDKGLQDAQNLGRAGLMVERVGILDDDEPVFAQPEE